MKRAVRDSLVVGHEPLIEALHLPDPKDRHVLAAAIRARAHAIVTRNLRDFPTEALAPWGIEARAPDDFLLDQLGLDPGAVHSALRQIADSWRNPSGSVEDVLRSLEHDGLTGFAAALRG